MEDPLETLSELGGHDVIEDGIDGRVDVEHDAGKVEHDVKRLDGDDVHYLDLQGDDPQREDLKGQHAGEEEDDDGGQHCDNLLPGAQNGGAICHHLQN